MICLNKNEQGAELLTGYLAKTLDAAGMAEAIERRDGDLARQLRRAAASVALNVAEGMGNTSGHKRQRYQTALGSAREVIACSMSQRQCATPARSTRRRSIECSTSWQP